MKLKKLKYLAICLPVLYLGYGLMLALQFSSKSELINSFSNGLFLFVITFLLIKFAKLKNGLDFIWFSVFILYIFILHHLVTYLAVGNFVNSTYTGAFHLQKALINLTPFTTIERTFHQTLPTMPTIVQIIGNAVMLAPLAFFLLYFKIIKSAWRAFIVVFFVSCVIELIQFGQTTLITGFSGMALPQERSTDIDDVILNTLSGGLGVIFFYLFPSFRKRIKK
ncbi:VanZ family protein [Listeria sp. PSOL-1]|uniref:VanZ family protein n=1 Tax=Listeria sp. PSOL-1 TaxID=1844999 RepID=UPI0013D80A70|nr:VanZ family protein [Listeria sp. PSOL-1]